LELTIQLEQYRFLVIQEFSALGTVGQFLQHCLGRDSQGKQQKHLEHQDQ
jgi:hypothetical protein